MKLLTTHQQHKLSLIMIKYIPIIMAFIMSINVVCSIRDVKLKYIDSVASISFLPAILMLTMQNTFQFCKVHKTCTLYTMITHSVVCNNLFCLKESLLELLEIIAAGSGAFIFVLLTYKMVLKHRKLK